MASNHDAPDATLGGAHTDKVSTTPAGRGPDSTPSEATERVHHERRREQRKIDDFNQDRDPARSDTEDDDDDDDEGQSHDNR